MDQPRGNFSGGPIAGFIEGWARIPFVGEKGHYWHEDATALLRIQPDAPPDVYLYRSLCGILGATYERVPALYPGTQLLCKVCQKKAPRWTRSEERKTLFETVPGASELFR